jgi:hypothetical protein
MQSVLHTPNPSPFDGAVFRQDQTIHFHPRRQVEGNSAVSTGFLLAGVVPPDQRFTLHLLANKPRSLHPQCLERTQINAELKQTLPVTLGSTDGTSHSVHKDRGPENGFADVALAGHDFAQ